MSRLRVSDVVDYLLQFDYGAPVVQHGRDIDDPEHKRDFVVLDHLFMDYDPRCEHCGFDDATCTCEDRSEA